MRRRNRTQPEQDPRPEPALDPDVVFSNPELYTKVLEALEWTDMDTPEDLDRGVRTIQRLAVEYQDA